MRSPWLGRLDHEYRSDLIVTASPATVSFLSAPPVNETVPAELRAPRAYGPFKG